MSDLIQVAFCCNDHRNGNFTGRFDAIYFYHPSGEPVKIEGGENAVSFSGRGVKVCRKTFRCRGHTQWVGNWCWDAVWMTPDDAAQLINYLRTLGGWRAHCAPSEIFDAINETAEPITGKQLLEAVTA